MLSCSVAALAYAPSLTPSVTSVRAASPSMDAKTFQVFVEGLDVNAGLEPLEKPWTSGEISDKAGLKDLAKKLNPIVGYWDPLNIGEQSKETIGWFRHAEIKHGRVAMAAFVGYLVQSTGFHFPWNLQGPFGLAVPEGTPTISFGDISAAGGPADQWDALPSAAKLQIIGAIGFLEAVGESSIFLEMDGQQHYVRGGKPGYYPKLKGKMPHPVPLNLWDPFGQASKQTPEQKEKSLLAEVNNGRLAMLGIMGLVSSSKGLIVPGLDSLPFPKYAGEIMAPFSNNPDLPGVALMNAQRASQIAREAAALGDLYLNNGA